MTAVEGAGVPRPTLYVESSALVKLAAPEAETAALRRFLSRWPLRATSALALTEVPRAVRRASPRPRDWARAPRVLASLVLVQLTEDLLRAAGTLEPPLLRSLDAIHLACAQALGSDLAGFVTYDDRLAQAAQQHGITVYTPR